MIAAHCKLDRLTLDVSDAYSPMGTFLGLRFAKSTQRFKHGMPKHLEIDAPSETLAKEVRAWIEKQNGAQIVA